MSVAVCEIRLKKHCLSS